MDIMSASSHQRLSVISSCSVSFMIMVPFSIPYIVSEFHGNCTCVKVFPDHPFISLASETTEVPILTCGGLTKRLVQAYSHMPYIDSMQYTLERTLV
jgi:hypothetical protein